VDGEPNVRLHPKAGWTVGDDCFCPALVQRDKVRQLEAARLRARTLRCWLAAVGILALAALAGGSIAYLQRNRAQAAERATKEESERRRQLLEEAARSDRLIAEQKLDAGLQPEAFAHLARACTYDPQSTLAAESAVAALNSWLYPPRLGICVGHQNFLRCAFFSPDGERVATASWDNTARIWETATGKPIAILRGDGISPRSVAFSPDGKRIVTASFGGPCHVWETATGHLLTTLLSVPYPSTSTAIFSKDGEHILASCDDMTARIWDAATGKELVILKGHESPLNSAEFSKDGRFVVTTSGESLGSKDNTARVWESVTGKLVSILSGHAKEVVCAIFSPDGRQVLTGSSDGTARIWETKTGNTVFTLKGHKFAVKTAKFSSDGQRIVTASYDSTARLWVAATGKLEAILTGHEHELLSAEFSSDGQYVVTASEDNTARVWEVSSAALIAILQGHQRKVVSAVFGPDSRSIVTASEDGRAFIWKSPDATLVRILKTSASIRAIALSPDGKTVAAGEGELVRLYDTNTLQEAAELLGHTGEIRSIAFSPDGRQVVTASNDRTARIWDVSTQRSIITVEGHKDGVSNAAFSPTGDRIVTASGDRTARVWDTKTGKPIFTVKGHSSWVAEAGFGSDGGKIVSASGDTTARITDAATGKELAVLAHKYEVLSGVFSPDNNRIATAAGSESFVWDAKTYTSSRTLRRDDVPVCGITFSPDSGRLAVASSNLVALKGNCIRLWDAATGQFVGSLEGRGPLIRAVSFQQSGEHVAAASLNKTAYLFTLLPPRAGPPPMWFSEFLSYMAQRRLNTDGEMVTVSSDEWLALREKLRGVLRVAEGKQTSYLDILRRFVRE